VLDKRIQTKNYGQLFLESLPDCTIQRAPLMNLAAAALRWVPNDPA
jgi:ATP-dependent DNA helicase DinG